MPTPIRPHPTRTAAAADRCLLRTMTCMLALCLGMQAVALSAQRVLGRVHFHRSAAQAVSPEPMRTPSPAHLSLPALFVHSYEVPRRQLRQPVAPAHPHAGLERHEHEAGDTNVVFIDEDHGLPAPTQGPAPARGLHDLDGLMPQQTPSLAAHAPARWLALAPPLARSQLTLPLERPPRA